MEQTPDIECVRAWAEGSLVGDELASFEARLGADPELRGFAASYRAVFLATRGLASEEASSTLSFEQLERGMDALERVPRRWPRRAAAALLLVAATAGAAWWGMRDVSGPRVVTLTAVPLELGDPSPEFAPLSPALAEFESLRDGDIQWLDSLADGVRLSRLSGAPVIVWGIHPTCPFCKRIRETTLLDGRVLAALEHWLPIQLDVMQTQYFDGLDPAESGFPIFELRDAEFAELATAYGYIEPAAFAALLEDNLPRGSREVGSLRAELELLAAAGADEGAGHLAAALQGYRRLVREAGSPALVQEGADGVERIAQRAGHVLASAFEARDPEPVLSAALAEFAGTEFAPDFGRVLDAYRASGGLPRLER